MLFMCHSEWSQNRDSDYGGVKNPVIYGRKLCSAIYHGIFREVYTEYNERAQNDMQNQITL
jgi:hypothetical protein